jgi:large subunit ribosomal protein L28
MVVRTLLWGIAETGRTVFKRAQRGLFAGKTRMTGNNVSFSEKKTRRCWKPNVQTKRLHSDILDKDFRLKVTTHALRCIKRKGSLDNYLLHTKLSALKDSAMALHLRSQLLQKRQ